MISHGIEYCIVHQIIHGVSTGKCLDMVSVSARNGKLSIRSKWHITNHLRYALFWVDIFNNEFKFHKYIGESFEKIKHGG